MQKFITHCVSPKHQSVRRKVVCVCMLLDCIGDLSVWWKRLPSYLLIQLNLIMLMHSWDESKLRTLPGVTGHSHPSTINHVSTPPHSGTPHCTEHGDNVPVFYCAQRSKRTSVDPLPGMAVGRGREEPAWGRHPLALRHGNLKPLHEVIARIHPPGWA